MSANLKFPSLCTRLNRAPVYVRGLQKRFVLPIPADSPSPPRSPRLRGETSHLQPTAFSLQTSSYPPAYATFLENVIHLRTLGISEETLLHLWTLERKLMQLLHADSTGSSTWFLDACGSKRQRNHRLLLSNFDIGVFLPSGTLQLGLNFADQPTTELFSKSEMGEDAIAVLRQYLPLHNQILHDIQLERPIVHAALRHFPVKRHPPTKRSKPRPQNKTGIDTLIQGDI